MSGPVVRMATLADAPLILAIYEPYVVRTAITFEYELVTVEAFQTRMNTVMQQFPWLVYEMEGELLGYAYCSRFKERAAFDWDCECSVYIVENAHRQGIATALYTKLFELVKQQGYYNIYALITYNLKSSMELHKKFGFAEVGVYQKTGYKLGKWWDLLVMEKRLHTFNETPIPPKSIHEIS